MALRHFVISSTARFFSEGTSRREMLSRTERTRSCGVFGLFDLLKRNAICLGGDSENCQAAGEARNREAETRIRRCKVTRRIGTGRGEERVHVCLRERKRGKGARRSGEQVDVRGQFSRLTILVLGYLLRMVPDVYFPCHRGIKPNKLLSHPSAFRQPITVNTIYHFWSQRSRERFPVLTSFHVLVTGINRPLNIVICRRGGAIGTFFFWQ